MLQGNENDYYDVTIVGLGMAGVRTLNEISSRLTSNSTTRIAVIDRDGEIGGMAYNPNYSPLPLLIHNSWQTLKPDKVFQDWFNKNTNRIRAYINEFGGERAKAWFTQQADMKWTNLFGEEIEEVRIPRAIYGLFLHDQVDEAIAMLEAKGVRVDVFAGEVEDIRPIGSEGALGFSFKDNKAVKLEWGKLGYDTSSMGWKFVPSPENQIISPRVTTGHMAYFPGSPTHKHWDNLQGEGYYENMYAAPSQQNNFHRLSAEIKRNQGADITVLGARESAADLWVWIVHDPELMALAEAGKLRLTHISNSGDGSMRDTTNIIGDYDPKPFIDKLRGINTAQGLLDAYVHEVESADRNRFSRYDVMRAINPAVDAKVGLGEMDGIVRLCDEELERFYDPQNWGTSAAVIIQKMNFLTSPDTYTALNKLRKCGAIKFVPAAFMPESAIRNNGKWCIKHKDNEGNIGEVSGDIIINAAGFGPTNENAENMTALFDVGLLRRNETGAGIWVGPDFTTSPGSNFYMSGIMTRGALGPLPSGAYTRSTASGNQGAIDYLSRGIACSIVSRLTGVNNSGSPLPSRG